MSVKSATIMRVYIKNCRVDDNIAALELACPSVALLVSSLEKSFANMASAGGAEEVKHEAIFRQLILIATSLDYSDEHGRVQMMEFLSMSPLPN